MQHVLSRSRDVETDLHRYPADKLKRAARFWVGKEATGFHKQKSIQALTKAFQGKTVATKVVPQLSSKEQQLLGIFARYGPVVSGPVLSVEIEQRGLAEKQDHSSRSLYGRRRNDLVDSLCQKLLLVGGGYDYYYSSFYGRGYPELTLNPVVAGAIEPAAPLPWRPSEASADATSSFARSPSEPAMDLWCVADALREMGNWKTVKGNALSKGSQNKLRTLVSLPSAKTQELAPPDPESLFYELLRAMDFLSVAVEPRSVLTAKVQQHFEQPPVVQGWHWLRAWLDLHLWQDGIGVVPDRDNDHEPVRIEPSALRQAKELLTWALCRVAHSPPDWLDLEVFLKDYWNATHEVAPSFYWYGSTWKPDIAMAREKDRFPAGNERRLAFWLDGKGAWVANAIMVTLATLGLIERGESGGRTKRPSFRLTPLGCQVFGAPELEAAERPAAEPFLTVQPSHEILAYLEAADARRVCSLARFARRSSVIGGRVQLFSLSRESVYAALESGMTSADIESFLTMHGKTELPANVRRALREWSGKRESLVLRSGVAIALAAAGSRLGNLGSAARALCDTSAVLPGLSARQAVQDFPGWSVYDHCAESPRVWQVDELGALQTSGHDLVSQQRLACLADRAADDWLVCEKSVARARKQGFTADQLLAWLAEHLSHETPALLATAIRNWTGRTSAFAGKVQLLQVTRTDACEAILHSAAFAPLLVGYIPPGWFIVRDDTIAEAKQLLKRLGFRLEGSYHAPSLDDNGNAVPERTPLPTDRTLKRRPRGRRRR